MYNIYFLYETQSMRDNLDGCSDFSISFDTVDKARDYFKRLINRARATHTLIDIEVRHDDTVIYDACYHCDGSVYIR